MDLKKKCTGTSNMTDLCQPFPTYHKTISNIDNFHLSLLEFSIYCN